MYDDGKKIYCIQGYKERLWYAHLKGFSYIPVVASFSEKKAQAMEYAKMYNGLPHKVAEIENRRKEQMLALL